MEAAALGTGAPDTVATTGRVDLAPNTVNSVPREVRLIFSSCTRSIRVCRKGVRERNSISRVRGRTLSAVLNNLSTQQRRRPCLARCAVLHDSLHEAQ